MQVMLRICTSRRCINLNRERERERERERVGDGNRHKSIFPKLFRISLQTVVTSWSQFLNKNFC